MRVLLPGAVAIAVLSGCAAPASQQVAQLNAVAACCAAPQQLQAAGTLATGIAGELTPQTPVVTMNGKRTPAMRFIVPAELAGRQLEIRATPMQARLWSGGIAFVPVATVFLAADGTPIATPRDTGLEAGPSRSMAFSYALWRTVTVPAGAASAVFYSDPALQDTEQTFAYRFGGMVPAGGVLIAQSAQAKAFYKVYGGFSVNVL